MASTPPASLDLTLRGGIKNGKEVYHEVALFAGVKYSIELAADDDDSDLDLYITDAEGNILYQDESGEAGAAAWFIPGERGVYNIFVKSASGTTDYTVTVVEE
jgi:hypothetical protein